MARKKQDAHHGGAWKVAYADFVTAMMALFMVLWISAQDQEILIATSRYFQSPFNAPMDRSTGIMDFKQSNDSGGEQEGGGEKSVESVDLSFLNAVAREFYRLLNVVETDRAAPVQVEVTSDGLRITVFDRADRPVFERDSTVFTEWGRAVMQTLAWIIDRHRFRVVIEGHTRAGFASPRPDYSAWDLSTDQANASRRALNHYAVDAGQFDRVSGFADTRPRAEWAPDDPSQQRITISLSVNGRKAGEPPGGRGVAQ